MEAATLSLRHPFPDKCGWNQAICYEREWHIFQAMKAEQTVFGMLFHSVTVFLYYIPLLGYIFYTITYVALSILDPNCIVHTYANSGQKWKNLLETRGLVSFPDIETPPRSHDFVRKDIHEKMDPIFLRQEKKNVLLVGPAGIVKTKIAATYGDGVVILDNFTKVDEKLLQKFNGIIIACARNPIPQEELLKRYFTIIEVEEPSDEITKLIIKARFPTAQDSVIDETLKLCHFYQPNLCMPGVIFELFDSVYSTYNEVTIEKVKEHFSIELKAPIRSPDERRIYYGGAREKLKRVVFGQDHVIDEVAMVFENVGSGFTSQGVLGCFHFAGPTGVGETALAEAMAEFYFESKDRVLFVPMAQYKDSHSLTGLLGSPPSFVGYDQGGLITEKAKKGPFVLSMS